MSISRYACPACGYITLSERHDWEICPICLWEDDVHVGTRTDVSSPANGGMLLSEAQVNFTLFGAIKPEDVPKVRPPRPDDSRDPDWVLLPKARELLHERGSTPPKG